ncbi:MAG TPA: Ig-like domain-containing protein [bacterium]
MKRIGRVLIGAGLLVVGWVVGLRAETGPLVPDSPLVWNTFLGGAASGVAVDRDGGVYVTGNSGSSWGEPIRAHSRFGADAFVAKLDANGVLQWNTFLGSQRDDYGDSIAVDASGNVYVTGSSEDAWGVPIRPFSGPMDRFVAKLDTNGALLWTTFFQGDEYGGRGGIAVDASGNGYVTGSSTVAWGAPVRAFSVSATGAYDIFVAKLDTSGVVLWNTFLGGAESDYGPRIAVDATGRATITGVSLGAWGDPVNAFVGTAAGVVARLDADGALQWHTFLPTVGVAGIAVDADANAFIAGSSSGSWGSPVRAHGQCYGDAFAAKIGADGGLVWNTFLGGSREDGGYGIELDTNGIIFIVGYTDAPTDPCCPTTWGDPAIAIAGGWDDAFVAKLSPDGALLANTFLGGSSYDEGFDVAVSADGSAHVTGWSMATWGNPVRPRASGEAAFVAKLRVVSNVPPSAYDQVLTTREDGYKSITSAATDSDGADGDRVLYRIVVPPIHGTVAAGEGQMGYWPEANFHGVDTFTFVASDDIADSNVATATVTITPRNDAPTFAPGPDQTVAKNAGPQTVTGWATGMSAGPLDESGQALDFIVTNDNSALFSEQPAVAVDGTLTFTPATDVVGDAWVGVKLHDDGGTADGGQDTSFAMWSHIVVGSSNIVADFQTLDVGVLEGAEMPITLTATHGLGLPLAYEITVPPMCGTLSGTPPHVVYRAASYCLLHDWGYDYWDRFDFRASDGSPDRDSAVVSIRVIQVNDAPSFDRGANQAVLEDAGAQSVVDWAANPRPGPKPERWQWLTFDVTNNNPGLFAVQPAISAAGALTYTPATEANGSAIVTVRLKDDGGTANGGVDIGPAQLFTITVNSVNDAPSFAKGADISVPMAAGSRTIAGWATAISPGPANESGQALAFSVTTDNSELFFVQPALSASGSLTFHAWSSKVGVAHAVVTLKDSGGTANGGVDTSASQTFTITVGYDRPYAVVGANPKTMYCPQDVTFDGGSSFNGGSANRVVSHAWDLHYDGSFTEEASGVGTAIAYGEAGEHAVALRVANDRNPAQTVTAIAKVTVQDRAPEASAGGPYTVAVGRPLFLSAAASSDPDAPCADAVARYNWDLDGDGHFDDAVGVAPTLGWEQVEAVVCGGACAPGASRDIAVQVTDRFGLSATARTTVGIVPARAKVTVTWPNGGEFLGTGRPQTIRWVSAPGVATVRISLSADGRNWRTIVREARASAGMAVWTPPPAVHRLSRRSWRVRVQGYRNGAPVAADVSDAPFGIGPLDVVGAEKGVEIRGGSTVRIRWARHRTPAPVAYTKLRYSFDGGRNWQKGVRIKGNPGEYLWKVPWRTYRAEGCRARVELYDAWNRLVGRDAGEGTFTILGGVDLTAPEGGDSVYGGTSRTVRWDTIATASVASVRLRLTLDGGASWTDLASIPGNPGHWHWQVPNLPAAGASSRIEVTLRDTAGEVIATDSGEGFFTILPRGGAYATAPPAPPVVPLESVVPAYWVSWGASGTPDASYQLEEAVDAEFTTGLRTVYTGDQLSVEIVDRTNGGTYYYRVRALRDGWNPSAWMPGGNGCAVSWEEPSLAPPSSFAATVSSDQVALAWVNPPQADFAGVRIVRRTDGAPVDAYDGVLVYDGSGQESSESGLESGAYFYAAFAYDAAMNFSAPATAIALIDPSTALAPLAVTVPSSSGKSPYQVSWEASPTPGATYELEEATEPTFGWPAPRQAYSGSQLAAQISGRTNGATYYYRVRALRAGWNPSAWVAAGNGCAVSWDAIAPGPVTNFSATVIGRNIRLAWVNPADTDLAGVAVRRRTDRLPLNALDGTNVYLWPGQPGIDLDLPLGTYYYAAFAYDAAGNYSPAATATATISVENACEGCHNGDGDNDGIWTGVGYDPDGDGPLPAAPNVMGDGINLEGVGMVPKAYDDGTYGFNTNGHGANGTARYTPVDSLGNPYLSMNARCTDCHDVSIPAGTHMDGVLNSVELKQNINQNTAHLNASYIGASTPDWSVQLTFDNGCAYQCHTQTSSHRHKFAPNPTPGVVRFGFSGSVLNGQGVVYPIDVHLSTNAPSWPADGVTNWDYAPCISCHNPHGTNTFDGSYPDNVMLRDERSETLCRQCHQ